MLIEVTHSQLMALTDIVAHYMRLPDHTDLFINCSESPAVETKPEDLLVVLLQPPPNQDSYIMGFINHDINIVGGGNSLNLTDKVRGHIGIDVEEVTLANQVLKLYQDADQAAFKLLQDAATERDAKLAKGHNGKSKGSK